MMVGSNERIELIEWARLWGKRSRSLGANARRGVHGDDIYLDVAVLTIGGREVFGACSANREQAASLVGRPMRDLFLTDGRLAPEYRSFEYPILDWLGKAMEKPVWELCRRTAGTPAGEGIAAYASSLYFDDLPWNDEAAGVEQMRDNARTDWERGHRAFKIKVGRGACHMDLEAGIRRDIAVVQGVRDALGPEAELMIDANNGYNLNIAKRVLRETRDCRLRFIEEPFHEDLAVSSDLHDWIESEGMETWIADGEGTGVHPDIVNWARSGIIDVLQFDIRWYGFYNLLDLEDRLSGSGVMQSPHNYPGPYGNYATAQIAPALEWFAFIEWDEVTVPELRTDAYSFKDGRCYLPNTPGMGLELDGERFRAKVRAEGWTVGM